MSSFASCSPNNKAGGQISGGGCPFAYFAHGQTSATNSPMRSRDTSPMPSRGGTIASPSLSQSNYVFKSSASRNFSIDNWVVENQRLVGLYEDFIHFEPVRNAWYNTSTESHTDGTNISIKPELMSILHGIEACMAVLSVFLNDKRPYVCKRSRIDMVCRDIFTQSMLLCNWHKEFEVCWNHCAFDTSSGSGSTSMNAMKSNSFQPTHGCASNGLYLLQQSLERNFADFSVADKCAAKMLVERLCVAFISIKLTYKTNLDVEAQLERISNIVGHNFIGNVLSDDAKTVNYACISQSHVIGTTLSCENYEHPEDFFFRTMHLVTECWAVVHNNYLDVAFEAAVARDWLCASEIIDRCNDVLNYMGDHMLLLCSMNLKDYLIYKVGWYTVNSFCSVRCLCISVHIFI